MKKIFFVLLLICVMVAFAQNTYEQIYENTEGIEITRIMEINSKDSIDQFRYVQTKVFNTNMSIIIKNNGIPKESIEIKERINYLPEGLNYETFPKAEEKEGRLKWEFNNLGANEEIKIIINFKDKIDFEIFEQIPSPYIEIHLKNAFLIVPTIGRIGDEMLITAITEDNEALPNIKIKTTTPNKNEILLTTDGRGVARITPQENGVYIFEIPDFKTDEIYSLEVEKIITSDLTTAQFSDNNLNVGDFVPFIVGLIIVAVLIFGMVLYLAPRHDNGPKPEDWAQAFENTENKEPDWMKDEKYFTETTIEKESSSLKDIPIKKPKIEVKKPLKTKNVKSKVEDIKTKTKKIIENRKKIDSKKTTQNIKKKTTKNNTTKIKKTRKKNKR